MASKKGSVKWNIPDVKESRSPRTPRSGRSHGDSVSEKYLYTDTFEGSSQSQMYSDTFTSESYSDTFVNESSTTGNGSKKADSQTDNIQTVISVTDRLDSSEIQEATHLETVRTATEALETVIEVDQSDASDYATTAIETRISETVRTALDTDAPENVLDTIYDVSDTQPLDSYSYGDSFDSAGKTHSVPVSDSFLESYTESKATVSKTTSRKSKFTTFDESLDGSIIAPDYDGKSLTDDEDEDATVGDEYSYTFEPTELSSQVHLVDPDEVQREAELDMVMEEAEKDFVAKLMNKLVKEPRPHYHKLNILPPDSDEDESEDDYQKHFCKKKIKMLKKKRNLENKGPSEVVPDTPHPLLAGRTIQTETCHVPKALLERAKLNNLMSAMNKAAKEEIHEPSKCPECRELKLQMDTEDTERRFVRQHTHAIKSRMMDIQVEQHLLKMNSISLIAELARGLPKRSEQPEKIMDQLLEPLLGKNVMR